MFSIGGLSLLLALGIGAGFHAPPSRATAADAACPPTVLAPFTNISRPIVPIGVTVIRGFTVNGDTISGVQLTAPPEYNAKQIPANNAYGLRFTAPHAGPFVVQATWSQTYIDDTGATVSCSATAGSTLTAAQGTPLTVKPPPAVKFPPSVHQAWTQYDNPLLWTWKCKADSDPTPLTVTVRWEVDPRPLPLFSKGGSAPFTFTARAKTFTVTTGDSCDVRQAGGVEHRLQQHVTLKVLAGGNVMSGNGYLLVQQTGGFRLHNHNAEPLHLGIVLKQGSRTLVNVRVCSWAQTGFELASGKGIDCWL